MKKIFVVLLSCCITIQGKSQVIADPALSTMKIQTISGVNLNPVEVPLGQVVVLKLPLQNRNLNNLLPSGTCKVKIGLGSKFIPDPAFNLATAHTSNYFTWTAEFSGGQWQLTGELTNILPPNYNDTAYLQVIGNIMGSSTVTTNFLVTNHNTSSTLSDEDPTNNSSFLPYTIVQGVIPVRYSGIYVTKSGCQVRINFKTELELNLKHFEIEWSDNGTAFSKLSTLAPQSQRYYQYSFEPWDGMSQNMIFIRIKSVDLDGKIQYSEVRSVSAKCETSAKMFLYPNPVLKGQKNLYIRSKNNFSNQEYKVLLYDAAGKLLGQVKSITSSTNTLIYSKPSLAPGRYYLRLAGNDQNEISNFSFIQY